MKKEEKIKENKEEKQSFFEKLKDKKYKAKLELTLGFGLIIILLVYANISGVGNNYNYNYNNTTTPTTIPNEEEDKAFILDKITDNYSYNIDIVLAKIDESSDQSTNQEENTQLKQYDYSYNGKTYKNNTIINKIVDNNTTTYYQVDNEYYTKENDTYSLDNIDNIYDLVDQKYLNLATIKEYINTASLDHTTNYSNGNTSYVYNLQVKDIIKSYTEDSNVKIEIDVENELPTIIIDYTNLLKVIDSTINECKVTIKYTDINTVEEFTIIDEEKQNTATD